MKHTNRIVELDENGEFKKTFFYKNDDKRQNSVRNHPGIKALEIGLERGKKLVDAEIVKKSVNL